MDLYFGLTPNRGPAASSSAVLQSPTGCHPRPAALSCGNQRAKRIGLRRRNITHDQAVAPEQELEADTEEDSYASAEGWETVWVSENGSQVLIDDEAKLPDVLLDAEGGHGNENVATKKLPAEMRYFDTASIYIKAGDGGNGCVAFRREKFVPRGGPAGGNGGRGGHVWAVVDPGLNSLSTFRKQLHYRGAPGVAGGGARKHGAAGADVHIMVPRGTIIRRKDAPEDEPPLAELLKPGSKALLAAGGRGGRGNASFKTGANNAPQLAETGEAGQELWAELELKLVADVGIIGVPNAGKSTLLSVVSAAKPKVADYPFTTLVPNLGVCEMDFRTTVFADVPGLLEGAHAGLGLGHEFLRHCQRSRVLVHIIDGTSPDPVGDYNAICTELELFNPELRTKPQVIAYNKMDLPDSSEYWEEVQEHLKEAGIAKEDMFAISAATGQGVIDLVRRLRSTLDSLPPLEDSVPSTNALNLTTPPKGLSEKRIDEFTITTDLAHGRFFFVEGEAIARFAQMTNWNYYEAMLRFQKVLEASGINRALKAKGVQEGDTVVIGRDMELEWCDDQSEGAIYGRWLDERKATGRGLRGSARWPHAG